MRNQLIARGWPSSLEVDTSQHYRAGDGVAFYGKLETKTLLALLPVLHVKDLLEETVVAELKETITDTHSSVLLNRNHLSERYSHAGTMTLRYSSDMQAPLTQLLLKALRAEINDICGRVAADGYRLCDAINPSYRPSVFQRKTRNFVVSVTETKPAEQGIDERSNDALDSCINAILQKNATFRTLEIRISYGENNKMLGRSWVRGPVVSRQLLRIGQSPPNPCGFRPSRVASDGNVQVNPCSWLTPAHSPPRGGFKGPASRSFWRSPLCRCSLRGFFLRGRHWHGALCGQGYASPA